MKDKCMGMMESMDPTMKQKCMNMMQEMMEDKDESTKPDLVFTHSAANSFADIEKRVEEDAKKIGLGLKKIYPFSVNLPEQQGFDINEAASVYELCVPSLAAELLNSQPELNVLMPCRISIYEKNEEVFVSTPNLVTQLDMLNCEEPLKSHILELYANMIEIISGW